MSKLSIVIASVLALACVGGAKTDASVAVDDTTTLASDTLVGLSPDAAGAATRAMPVSAPLDTSWTAATPNELASFAATLMIPVQGVVVGQLRDSYTAARLGHAHEALDIMAPRGTPVVSATDGRVTQLHESVAGGTMVYAADASDRFILMYGHLDRYADGLVQGMPLKRGQVLGYVGSTGNVPPGAPHLHFAIARGRPSVAWWKGEAVNPYTLFVPPAIRAAVDSPLATPPVAAILPPVAPAVTPAPATAALEALRQHDMTALAVLVDPAKGLRFSPYAHVDKKADRVIARDRVKALWNSSVSVWGTHDGSGAPLRLTYPEYHKSFVYDADFARAPKVAFNAEPIGRGTVVNNIATVYPKAIIVEYHVPGSDPKLGGMDWKSLWLVFEESGKTWYLVGIVHGAWTI